MATVTARVSTPSTANGNSYVSGAFTPAAGELLVAFVVRTCSTDDLSPTMTDTQNLGFALIGSCLGGSATGFRIFLFISLGMATASSMTVTFADAAVTPTGAALVVAGVSGMWRGGAAAVRTVAGVQQLAKAENQTAATTPNVVFSNATLAGNPTLACLGNSSNPATMTPPTSWTEDADTGYATPATGLEYVARDSGFAGSTITWGSLSANKWGVLAVELDTSQPPAPRVVGQAVQRAATYCKRWSGIWVPESFKDRLVVPRPAVI